VAVAVAVRSGSWEPRDEGGPLFSRFYIFTASMKYLRRLLFPFSLIYGLVVIVRNWCYDSGIFKSQGFNKPVICIGNLDVGGAGKTPMTEYLVRLLKDDYNLATLSRGYGRETRGFIEVGSRKSEGGRREEEVGSRKTEVGSRKEEVGSQEEEVGSRKSEVGSQELGIKNQEARVKSGDVVQATRIGDEPAQFAYKFPDITVAVCEKRAEGITKLLPDHDVILLDDAFQHRAVSAGLNILLFDYNRLDEPHLLLPAGNLREPFSGRWRAQIIIVTKCPVGLTGEERQHVADKIAPLPYQEMFFTSIAYGQLLDMAGHETGVAIDKETTVFLLTGIANAGPLVHYLSAIAGEIIHHKYPDHHRFTQKNIAKLAGEYRACASQKKMIVTTEKDARRLEETWLSPASPADENIPVYVLPIQADFLESSGDGFDQLITDYVRAYTTNDGVY